MAKFTVYFTVKYKVLDKTWDVANTPEVCNSLTKVNAYDDAWLHEDKIIVGCALSIEATTQIEAFQKAEKAINEQYKVVTWTVEDFSLGTIREIDIKFYSAEINLLDNEATDEVEGFVYNFNSQYQHLPSNN